MYVFIWDRLVLDRPIITAGNWFLDSVSIAIAIAVPVPVPVPVVPRKRHGRITS